MGPLREGSPITILAREQTYNGVRIYPKTIKVADIGYEGRRPIGYFKEEDVDELARKTVPGHEHYSQLMQRREWVIYLDSGQFTDPVMPGLPAPSLDYKPRSYLPQTA